MTKQIKTITAVIAGLALTLGLTFTSCKKGDTGPAGPQGPTGATGNANVQSTTFLNQGFAYVAANSDYEINLTVPAVTSAVMNNGGVLVYFQPSSSTGVWLQLPATFGGTNIQTGYALGQVGLISTSALSILLNVKVVVIPPAMVKPNVNTKNYSEVKAAYNLKD
ncbi:MAG: hypothetical protein JSU07_13250 [Bacteroidetes bacterium]|nr:hypothetical protein [Bacteroidota bacterium]